MLFGLSNNNMCALQMTGLHKSTTCPDKATFAVTAKPLHTSVRKYLTFLTWFSQKFPFESSSCAELLSPLYQQHDVKYKNKNGNRVGQKYLSFQQPCSVLSNSVVSTFGSFECGIWTVPAAHGGAQRMLPFVTLKMWWHHTLGNYHKGNFTHAELQLLY